MSALAMVDRADAPDGQESASGPTLDRLIGGTWLRLSSHRAVECPMCGEQMAPKYGAHALPIGGRCTSCGTELS